MPIVGRLAALASAIAIGLALAGPAQAEKEVTVSVIYGPDKPQSLVWYRMDEILQERAPSAFSFNVVTNGALGGEKETAEGVRLGSIQAALSTVANLSTWVPEGAVFDMPFVFSGHDHINAVVNGPIGEELKTLYEAQGFKVLGFITYGARNVIAKEPIRTPNDVQGKKMRVLQSPLHIELWKSLGANPQAIPITEAYNALQTNVVDLMDMTKSGYHALKLFEVVPDFSETQHIWALGVMYVDKNWWDQLSPKDRNALQSAADAAIPYFNQLAADEQDAALEKAKHSGNVTVIQPDVDVWRAAMEPFWNDYADQVGGIERVRAIVAADPSGN